MGVQKRDRGVSCFPCSLWPTGEVGEPSGPCYFVSIGKRMTPAFLPYNNMLINPLGPLRSGKLGSPCLQEPDGC